MRKKTKFRLAAGLLILLGATLIAAGCRVGQPTHEEVQDKYGIRSSVTYFSNGGSFNESGGSLRRKYIEYQENAPVINVGVDEVSGLSIQRSGYVFDGWYYAELDENGEPIVITEEPLEVESSDREVEFPIRIPAGEKWYICAHWMKDVELEIRLVSDSPISVQQEDAEGQMQTVTYETGDVIRTQSFGTQSYIDVSSNAPIASIDSTFLRLYSDEVCETPFSGRIEKPQNGENAVLYAKYIEGIWTIVRTPSEVSSMLGNTVLSSNKYYIDADIDCASVSFGNHAAFNCTIAGNGHTISNLTFTASNINSNNTVSPFGTFGARASVTGLTLKNINVEYKLRPNVTAVELYAFAEGANDAAILEDVVIDGLHAKFELPEGAIVGNLPFANGSYGKTNWMFGGRRTDEAFLEAFPGITVKDATCVINENQ